MPSGCRWEKNQTQIIQSVAWQWGQRDPAAAVTWLSTLPENQASTQAYQQVTNQWMNADPERAKQWLRSLPAGDRRDQLLESPFSKCCNPAAGSAADGRSDDESRATDAPDAESRQPVVAAGSARLPSSGSKARRWRPTSTAVTGAPTAPVYRIQGG